MSIISFLQVLPVSDIVSGKSEENEDKEYFLQLHQ